MNGTLIIAPLLVIALGSTPAPVVGSSDANPVRPELMQFLKLLGECRSAPVITEIERRIPDVNCPSGGKLISVGADQNGDGRLAPAEIQHVVELCDGSRDETLAALEQRDACLHVEVASALRFSLELERALAPENRDTPAKLLRELPRYPSDS